MANDKTWATETEIFAAAKCLNTDIYVYTPNDYRQHNPWLRHKCTMAQTSGANLLPALYLENAGGVHFNIVSEIHPAPFFLSPQFKNYKSQPNSSPSIVTPEQVQPKPQPDPSMIAPQHSWPKPVLFPPSKRCQLKRPFQQANSKPGPSLPIIVQQSKPKHVPSPSNLQQSRLRPDSIPSNIAPQLQRSRLKPDSSPSIMEPQVPQSMPKSCPSPSNITPQFQQSQPKSLPSPSITRSQLKQSTPRCAKSAFSLLYIPQKLQRI